MLAGTSLEEAQENNQLAHSILDDSELKTIFGVYKVPGHRVVTLNRKRGRPLLATNCLI